MNVCPPAAFEGRALWAIEDKERRDIVGEETDETIVEGSEGGVVATLAGVNLEGPDGGVDGDAETAAGMLMVLEGVSGEGDAGGGRFKLGEETRGC